MQKLNTVNHITELNKVYLEFIESNQGYNLFKTFWLRVKMTFKAARHIPNVLSFLVNATKIIQDLTKINEEHVAAQRQVFEILSMLNKKLKLKCKHEDFESIVSAINKRFK